jgi:hypothetical protein
MTNHNTTVTRTISRINSMASKSQVSFIEGLFTGPCTMIRKYEHPGTGLIAIAGIAIIFLLLIVTSASATDTKATYLGDMVTLSGNSPGSDIVYLFMTGPNLPSNGVALNNINRRADMGGFSTADVNPDGSWIYKWYTNQIGGKIDAGTYTVWVTDRPVDRSHLSGSDYRSITVVLQQPGISAGSSTATGALLVRSIPDGAVLFLNGENRGVTPVTIPDLPVGGHVLVLSSPGYQNMTTQAIIREGAITEVNVPLYAMNGSLYINTTPGGAEISLDGRPAGVSPVLLEDLVPGNHSLVTRKSGYNATYQEVRVIGGHMMVVQLSLEEGTRPAGTFPSSTRAPGIGPVIVVISIISSILLLRRTKRN